MGFLNPEQQFPTDIARQIESCTTFEELRDILSLTLQTSFDDKTPGVVLSPGSFNLGYGQFAKNKIINGRMDIAQRGTSFSNPANGQYLLDRWVIGKSGTAVLTVSQQQYGPSAELRNVLWVSVDTAQASFSPSEGVRIVQRIEGYAIRDLVGETFTISFWVCATKAGVYSLSIRNGIPDRSYIMEYTVAASNVWQKVSLTLPGGLITDGTWNYDNGIGVVLSFELGSSAGARAASNVWHTNNYTSSPNQVNALDAVGNVFSITGVQLEVGSAATPFEHRPVSQELTLCERYYQQIRIAWQTTASLSNYGVWYNYKQVMRDIPSATYLYDSGGSGGSVTAETAALIQTSGHSIITNGRVLLSAEL
jgi:hypothetical protein